jgi:catalase
VHNNQRDGMHRQALHRGRVSYEPNSLAGGCPFQAGMAGFVSASEPASRGARQEVPEDKVRGKPEKFADHYSQAQLFWRSQTVAEKRHIANAFRFELSRVTVPAVRERVVSQLVNVDVQLARAWPTAWAWPCRRRSRRCCRQPVHSEVEGSPGLSLFARPGSAHAAGRRVAVLVAPGVDGAPLRAAYRRLAEARAVPRFVGLRLGRVDTTDGEPIEVEASVEAMPSVLWDAVVLPGGDAGSPCWPPMPTRWTS